MSQKKILDENVLRSRNDVRLQSYLYFIIDSFYKKISFFAIKLVSQNSSLILINSTTNDKQVVA
jgi:hypothetical protein